MLAGHMAVAVTTWFTLFGSSLSPRMTFTKVLRKVLAKYLAKH